MPVGVSVKEDPNNRTVIETLRSSWANMRREFIKETDGVLLDVLRDSKTVPPRVPLDTGALQGTGHVEPSKEQGGIVRGYLQYGGATVILTRDGRSVVDYAVYVHEDMSATYKRPGSGPKFVEAHFNRRENDNHQRMWSAGRRGLPG